MEWLNWYKKKTTTTTTTKNKNKTKQNKQAKKQLASKPNYHITKYFPENLMAIEMKRQK